MWLMDKAENLISQLKWYDLSLLKLSVFLFALFLVGIWPAFTNAVLSVSPYWFLAAWLIISTPLLKKMFA